MLTCDIYLNRQVSSNPVIGFQSLSRDKMKLLLLMILFPMTFLLISIASNNILHLLLFSLQMNGSCMSRHVTHISVTSLTHLTIQQVYVCVHTTFSILSSRQSKLTAPDFYLLQKYTFSFAI